MNGIADRRIGIADGGILWIARMIGPHPTSPIWGGGDLSMYDVIDLEWRSCLVFLHLSPLQPPPVGEANLTMSEVRLYPLYYSSHLIFLDFGFWPLPDLPFWGGGDLWMYDVITLN
jgi:hypothetical protein